MPSPHTLHPKSKKRKQIVDDLLSSTLNANVDEALTMILEDFLIKVDVVKEEDVRGVLPHKIRPRKPHPQDQAPIAAENTALQVNLKLVG